jgi:signal peptidase I
VRLSWVRVIGSSMAPAIAHGDCVLVLWMPNVPVVGRLARWLTARRGSIVMIRADAHLRRLEVKRVTAVAGDAVQWEGGARRLRTAEVFVEGSSAQAEGIPADSRTIGPLRAREIVGRVLAVQRCELLSAELPTRRKAR